MKTVVLADENHETRSLLALCLTSDDYEVVGQAGDGRVVIDLVSETNPDVIVVDLEMPEVGGLDALPALRAAAPSTAVVVYSANLAPVVRSAVERLGAWPADKVQGLAVLSETVNRATSGL